MKKINLYIAIPMYWVLAYLLSSFFCGTLYLWEWGTFALRLMLFAGWLVCFNVVQYLVYYLEDLDRLEEKEND